MRNQQHRSTTTLLATTLTLLALGGLTAPVSAADGDKIVLTGFARDFPASHEDFAVLPPVPDGNGHYAGNVSQILGADGAPLQVHGVSDFNINFGSLVPGTPYAARLTVLGAEITSGGNPMPVTIETETSAEVFEPFGLYLDPGGNGDVNDGSNPRHFIYSLDDIYSAGTPISVTATSWLPQFETDDVGYDQAGGSTTETAQTDQLATQVTLPEDGTVTSITAYVSRSSGSDDDLMYALYDDNGGEPGDLILQTAEVNSSSGSNWHTINIPDTWLAGGDYWLAVTMEDDDDQAIAYQTAGGYETRRHSQNAVDSGFVATWDTPHKEIWNNRRLSIYMTYTSSTPTYAPYMTAKSGDDSQQVIVLRNGSDVPAIDAFQDQTNLAAFVDPYVNVATGKIVLQDNQAIYLFELGTSNLSSSAADFQDLVIMVTLATDPVYFFDPGATSSSLLPIGYKVDNQWEDTDGNSIAPHTYVPAFGDEAGEAGVLSNGGVTSPATFYEWFRDILGENMGTTVDITLTENGNGVYEIDDEDFMPLNGQLYGNEGEGENDNFTFAVAAEFTYDASANQFMEFKGGDGAWIFINGKLAIDLGGVDSSEDQYASVDRFGLVDGEDYDIRIFYANRGSAQDFMFRTNVFLTPGPVLGSSSAAFD